MTIDELNTLSESQAHLELKKCCVSTIWIKSMINARPFTSIDEVYKTSDNIWKECHEADYLEAFKGHPKIGDISSLAKKFSNSSHLASDEQRRITSGNIEVLKLLAEGNINYEDKFGFIFIVCATGKSAKEMLYLLEQRIDNDREYELSIAAAEQHKITAIRLDKLLA